MVLCKLIFACQFVSPSNAATLVSGCLATYLAAYSGRHLIYDANMAQSAEGRF